MSKRSWPSPLTPPDVECLIAWPKSSVGEEQERVLLNVLLSACNEFGYGRVSQLVEQIRDLWRRPEREAVYAEEKRQHLEAIKQ